MVALYITSVGPGAGRTTVAAALGKNLQAKGVKVGYLKPVTSGKPDADAVVMKQVLGLKESEDVLSPVARDAKEVSEACARVSQGRDVVIVEGSERTPGGVVSALAARVILVAAYSAGLPAELDASAAPFGASLVGVVVNKVPKSRVEDVQRELSGRTGGVKLIGVVPEDRTLAALTVGELAERLGGEILTNSEKSGELVEEYMVGALGLDSGVTYFNRKTAKAVIARAERPDMHMAALETPTRCLVVSGDKAPTPVVLSRAKQKKVPVIMVKGDIKESLSRIESVLENVPFRQGKKLSRLTEVMGPRLDFPLVYQALGLAVE